MNQGELLWHVEELVKSKCLRAVQVADLQLNLKRFVYEPWNLLVISQQIKLMVDAEADRKKILAEQRKKNEL